jgi:hypothetical protein
MNGLSHTMSSREVESFSVAASDSCTMNRMLARAIALLLYVVQQSNWLAKGDLSQAGCSFLEEGNPRDLR